MHHRLRAKPARNRGSQPRRVLRWAQATWCRSGARRGRWRPTRSFLRTCCCCTGPPSPQRRCSPARRGPPPAAAARRLMALVFCLGPCLDVAYVSARVPAWVLVGILCLDLCLRFCLGSCLRFAVHQGWAPEARNRNPACRRCNGAISRRRAHPLAQPSTRFDCRVISAAMHCRCRCCRCHCCRCHCCRCSCCRCRCSRCRCCRCCSRNKPTLGPK